MMLFLALQAIVQPDPGLAVGRRGCARQFEYSCNRADRTGLAAMAAYNLFIDPPEGHDVPLKWQIGIAVFLLGSVSILVLVRAGPGL